MDSLIAIAETVATVANVALAVMVWRKGNNDKMLEQTIDLRLDRSNEKLFEKLEQKFEDKQILAKEFAQLRAEIAFNRHDLSRVKNHCGMLFEAQFRAGIIQKLPTDIAA